MVSIVIPCRNEEKFIANCLESIIKNGYPLKDMEILVVDGQSTDSTRDLIRLYEARYSMIKLLDNPDRITPKALNTGINNARGDIIMRMDVHAEYKMNYITILVEALEKYNCDNVGGVWEIQPGKPGLVARAIAVATSSPFGIGNAWYKLGVSKAREVDTVPYGCYKREVFKKIGLFDEELVKNQDDEFNARLIKAGGKIMLIPEARIKYYARKSLKEISKMFFLYGYYKPLVNMKIGKPGTIRQLVPPLFVLSIVILAILGLFYNIFLIALLLLLAIYIMTDALVSARLSFKKGNSRLALLLMIIFPTIHFSYGIAYIFGQIQHPLKKLFR